MIRRIIRFSAENRLLVILVTAVAVGYGIWTVRTIPVDARFRMSLDGLTEAIEHDLAAGVRPWLVVASAGTVDTGAVDPVEARLAARLVRASRHAGGVPERPERPPALRAHRSRRGSERSRRRGA